MSVQNMEQLRAAHALRQVKTSPDRFRTANKADVTKSVTTMVMDSGMLAAMAYALDNNDEAYTRVFLSFMDYRKSGIPKLQEYLEALAKADAYILRTITSDFLGYMKYLRRFANMKETHYA